MGEGGGVNRNNEERRKKYENLQIFSEKEKKKIASK